MGVYIYITGELQAMEYAEPFQATMNNMSAALNAGLHFFVTTNMQGEDEAIRIGAVTRIRAAD